MFSILIKARVIGHEKGKGRNADRCGALRCEMESGKKFSVGSGLRFAFMVVISNGSRNVQNVWIPMGRPFSNLFQTLVLVVKPVEVMWSQSERVEQGMNV